MNQRPSFHDISITECYLIASRSIDTSTKVGAVLVDQDNVRITDGYNNPPRGIEFEQDDIRHQRPEKYYWFEHAERNAIYNASRQGKRLKDATLYVIMYPCADCARAIIQTGIKKVVIHKEGYDIQKKHNEMNERWKDSHRASEEMFKLVHIEILFHSCKLIQPVGCFNGKEYSITQLKPKTIKTTKTKDMMSAQCEYCKQGIYIETFIYDDLDGVLHCNACGDEIKRHISDTRS